MKQGEILAFFLGLCPSDAGRMELCGVGGVKISSRGSSYFYVKSKPVPDSSGDAKSPGGSLFSKVLLELLIGFVGSF